MGMHEYGQIAIRIEDIKAAELTRKPSALSKLVLLEYLEESLHASISGAEMMFDDDEGDEWNCEEELEDLCKNKGWVELSVKELEEMIGMRPPKQVALLRELQNDGKLQVSLRGMPAKRFVLLPSVATRAAEMTPPSKLRARKHQKGKK